MTNIIDFLSQLDLTTNLFSIFGIDLVLSTISDFTHLFTLHIFCFYRYAEVFHTIIKSAISNYWLLFRGKKYNPLRNRKDKISLGTDEVILSRTILGSALFCVSILLYPTVFIYFLVCKVLYLSANAVCRKTLNFIINFSSLEFIFQLPKKKIIFQVQNRQSVISNIKINLHLEQSSHF